MRINTKNAGCKTLGDVHLLLESVSAMCKSGLGIEVVGDNVYIRFDGR